VGALAEEEAFPSKLLDCETFEYVRWPEEFVRAGEVRRFDYASRIHSDDGSWENFMHRMTLGVECYLPADDPLALDLGESGGISESVRLREPYQPVNMGYVHRLYFINYDGLQIVMANVGLGVDEEDAEEKFRQIELPRSVFAWDPEEQRLLALSEDGAEVRFVLAGGLLRLAEDAKIVG